MFCILCSLVDIIESRFPKNCYKLHWQSKCTSTCAGKASLSPLKQSSWKDQEADEDSPSTLQSPSRERSKSTARRRPRKERRSTGIISMEVRAPSREHTGPVPASSSLTQFTLLLSPLLCPPLLSLPLPLLFSPHPSPLPSSLSPP